MMFKINSGTLKALNGMFKAIPLKVIEQKVEICPDKKGVKFASSNLEYDVEIIIKEMPYECNGFPDMIISMENFKKIAAAMKNGGEISRHGDIITVQSGKKKLTIRNEKPDNMLEKKYKFTKVMEIPADELLQTVTKLDKFKSDRQSRLNLTGINFNSDSGRIAATDGFTMAYRDINSYVYNNNGEFTINGDLKSVLSKFIRKKDKCNVKIFNDSKNCVAKFEADMPDMSWKITAKCIDGKYPDLQSAIDRLGANVSATIKKDDMMESFDGFDIIKNNDGKTFIYMTRNDDGFHLKSSDNKSVIENDLDCEVIGDMDNLKCVIDLKILKGAIDVFSKDESFEMGITGNLNPIRFTNGEYTSVVCPFRTND